MCVWTASAKSADVCFHSYWQMLWHVPNIAAVQRFVVQIALWCHCAFAHLWCGARPQLRLPVDSTATKRRSTSDSVREWGRGKSEVRPKVQGNDHEPEPAGQIWTKKEREDPAAARLGAGALGAKLRYFSIGTPCDLLLCLSFSSGGWRWEKWLWDSVFSVQETSPAFLGRLLVHSGGGPPQICPPADPEPRSIVVSTTLSRIYWQRMRLQGYSFFRFLK